MSARPLPTQETTDGASRTVLDTLYDVPEAFHAEYKEVDGKRRGRKVRITVSSPGFDKTVNMAMISVMSTTLISNHPLNTGHRHPG